MAVEADQALCLRAWDWSETSQTAALFTRDHGLLRVLAKGSKRPKSAFSGGLEPLTAAHIQFHLKPTSELALLTRWDLAETFPALRADLPSHYAGLYLADLLLHVAAAHDPHPGLFDALLTTLRRLAPGRPPAGALVLGQWAVLVEGGYRPELDASVVTGEALEGLPGYLFDPFRGGLAGPADTAPARGADGVDWRLRGSTVEALRTLARAPGSGPEADQADRLAGVPDDVLERAARFLAVYLRHVLGQELPSYRWAFPDVPGASRPLPTGVNPRPLGG